MVFMSSGFSTANQHSSFCLAPATDGRVFELLDTKFKLFDSVFDASDEIPGANDILKKCRHADEIKAEFNTLQTELDDLIEEKEQNTREKLLKQFDEGVISHLKSRKEKIQRVMDEHGRYGYAAIHDQVLKRY